MKNTFLSLGLLLTIGSSPVLQAMEVAVVRPDEKQHVTQLQGDARSSSQILLDAIRQAKPDSVFYALNLVNADCNLHGTVSDSDFNATDWTPLLEAVAHLKSTVITAQSGVIASYWGWGYFGSGAAQKVKDRYNERIGNLTKIINLLLKQPGIDKSYQDHAGRSAASICLDALRLLKVKTLYPPFEPREPEPEYVRLFESILRILPQSGPVRTNALPDSYSDSCCRFSQNRTFQSIDKKNPPIVYHPIYNVRAWGIENLHPFDTKKYEKIEAVIKEHLKKELKTSAVEFHKPEIVPNEDLRLVHSQEYIDSLKLSSTFAELAEVAPLGMLRNTWTETLLLEPVKYSTGGTILATELALKHGWAINLSAGFHHAKRTELVVGGFCPMNDVVIAAKKVLAQHPDYKILIVDLDAHQGNGNADAVEGESRIAIMDVYNGETWPGDIQRRINFDYPLPANTTDHDYLGILTQELPKVINKVKPNFIMYNAGTDPLDGDPLGKLALTKEGIFKRDLFVFKQALERKIPIMMVLSGGYHPKYSIDTISGSIINIWNELLSK